ncbi:uncharacterized protein C6orf141 homolog [Echinops telfairi]|uniref:Uncharacterized protein C6orf141 homolog n=1 Tax=Echinops telfairi TaxID=9371 RepID=A0ABM0IBV9_ECHTE|nr:uncharacterized protein C6orf141 homolog [Echinops telfairi]
MNEPPDGMGALGARGAGSPRILPRRLERAGSFPLEQRPRAPLAPARPGGRRGSALEQRAAAGAPGARAGEDPDCEPWVREKVLFLLHPQRWLGTPGDPAPEEVARGDCQEAAGPPGFPGEEPRTSGSPGDAASGAQGVSAAARPTPLLVRVVDYHGTQEVQQTAWTKGCMTTKTEEHSVTAVTFRTHRV